MDSCQFLKGLVSYRKEFIHIVKYMESHGDRMTISEVWKDLSGVNVVGRLVVEGVRKDKTERVDWQDTGKSVKINIKES